MAERLYSLHQTADLLGTSLAEVREWIHLGRLPAEQTAGEVRVSERGLVRFLTDRGIDLGAIVEAITEPETPDDAHRAPSDAAQADAGPSSSTGQRGRDAGNAVSRLAEAILHDALRRGADAIYLEPVPGSLTLRLRVGGRVREKPRFASRLPRGLGPLLLDRLRAMGHLAESGGHKAAFSVHLQGHVHAFRIEDYPSLHGTGLAIYPVTP